MAQTEVRPAPRRRPLRTNDQIYDAYGTALAKQVRSGRAPFQTSTAMRTPHTPAVPAYSFTDPDGVERVARAQPARAYGPAKAHFLRAYAAEVGLENPQFVSARKAIQLLRAAGHDGNVQAAVKGASYVEIPRNRSAANMPTLLTDDGPNFTESGQPVAGKKGDVARDDAGKVVVRAVQFGPLADDPPLDVNVSGPDWEKFQRQSRPNRVLPIEQSNATAEPLPVPSLEDGRDAVDAMLQAARRQWGVEFKNHVKGRGFSVKVDPDGERRAVVALPRFDPASAGQPGSPWESESHYVTRLAVEVSHACAYEQAKRDPEARPDPLVIQEHGARGKNTAAYAREDMVANMASIEFVTSAGYRFEPGPSGPTSHLRDAQAEALAEPGGYAKVTYNAARTLRMLHGQQPTQRDEARVQRQERFAERVAASNDIERAAAGIPLDTVLTADAGARHAENRPPRQTGESPAHAPARARSSGRQQR